MFIDLMKRFTPKPEMDGEIGEQDAGGASSGGGKQSYPTVTKWESGVARTGPAR